MPIKLIIADVDGCLTPEESVPWELERFAMFAARSREAAEGSSELAPFTLCTGRPQPYCEVLMKLMDVRVPAICENGAVLYSLHDNYARYAPGVTEEKLTSLRTLRTHLEMEVLPRYPQAVLQFGKEAQLSVFSQDPTCFAEIQPELERFVQDSGLVAPVITASHFYLNISLAGVDKGTTLHHLLAELGLNRGEVAGIGDTEGDLPLREAVGFFACPANAQESIKQAADYVSPSPTLEGVLDILTRPEFRRGGKT